MSRLRRGDEEMHYSDSSHRWIAPPDVEQHIWDAVLHAHLDQHRATMGGPVTVDELWECGPPHPVAPERSLPHRRGSGREADTQRSTVDAVRAAVEAVREAA